MRSKEQQLHLNITTIASHYVPPQQKRGGTGGGVSVVVGVPLPHTTLQQDTYIMTPERRIQIEEHDSPLTANELALGWHFCPAFDGMLTSGEPTNRDTPEGLLTCACGNKINPNTCITYEGEEPHGSRDTFVPPPEKLDKFGFPVRTIEQQLADLKAEIAAHDPDLEMPCDTTPESERIAEQENLFKLLNPTDNPAPVKCDDDCIREFEAAQDKLTDQALTATNSTMMTPSRWLELTMNSSYGHLTPLERQEGWHYCPRLDDKLTKMQDNQCKLCGADQGPDPLELVVCPPNEQQLSDITVSKVEPTIHQHDGKWWYWDETNMHRHGPYETYAECLAGLKHYCHVYLGHPEDPS